MLSLQVRKHIVRDQVVIPLITYLDSEISILAIVRFGAAYPASSRT